MQQGAESEEEKGRQLCSAKGHPMDLVQPPNQNSCFRRNTSVAVFLRGTKKGTMNLVLLADSFA